MEDTSPAYLLINDTSPAASPVERGEGKEMEMEGDGNEQNGIKSLLVIPTAATTDENSMCGDLMTNVDAASPLLYNSPGLDHKHLATCPTDLSTKKKSSLQHQNDLNANFPLKMEDEVDSGVQRFRFSVEEHIYEVASPVNAADNYCRSDSSHALDCRCSPNSTNLQSVDAVEASPRSANSIPLWNSGKSNRMRAQTLCALQISPQTNTVKSSVESQVVTNFERYQQSTSPYDHGEEEEKIDIEIRPVISNFASIPTDNVTYLRTITSPETDSTDRLTKTPNEENYILENLLNSPSHEMLAAPSFSPYPRNRRTPLCKSPRYLSPICMSPRSGASSVASWGSRGSIRKRKKLLRALNQPPTCNDVDVKEIAEVVTNTSKILRPDDDLNDYLRLPCPEYAVPGLLTDTACAFVVENCVRLNRTDEVDTSSSIHMHLASLDSRLNVQPPVRGKESSETDRCNQVNPLPTRAAVELLYPNTMIEVLEQNDTEFDGIDIPNACCILPTLFIKTTSSLDQDRTDIEKLFDSHRLFERQTDVDEDSLHKYDSSVTSPHSGEGIGESDNEEKEEEEEEVVVAAGGVREVFMKFYESDQLNPAECAEMGHMNISHPLACEPLQMSRETAIAKKWKTLTSSALAFVKQNKIRTTDSDRQSEFTANELIPIVKESTSLGRFDTPSVSVKIVHPDLLWVSDRFATESAKDNSIMSEFTENDSSQAKQKLTGNLETKTLTEKSQINEVNEEASEEKVIRHTQLTSDWRPPGTKLLEVKVREAHSPPCSVTIIVDPPEGPEVELLPSLAPDNNTMNPESRKLNEQAKQKLTDHQKKKPQKAGINTNKLTTSPTEARPKPKRPGSFNRRCPLSPPAAFSASLKHKPLSLSREEGGSEGDRKTAASSASPIQKTVKLSDWLKQKDREDTEKKLRRKAVDQYREKLHHKQAIEEEKLRKETFQNWLRQKEVQKNWERLLREREMEEKHQILDQRTRDVSEQAFKDWVKRKNKEATLRAKETRERVRIGQAIFVQRQRSITIVRAMQKAHHDLRDPYPF